VNIVKSLLVLLEIFLFIFAMFCYFRKRYYFTAESWCFSIIIVFAIYSASIQIFFWSGIIQRFFIVDIIIIIISAYLTIKNNDVVYYFFKDLVNIFKLNRLILSFYSIIYVYLFLQVILLPPINVDSLTYNLSRVMLMIKEGSIVLKNYSTLHQVNFVWGYDILSYLFQRNYCDCFLSIFSYLSYILIILSNYALVISVFNNRRLAILISLIVSSLPALVLQATSTKPDIGAAACTMVMFLAGYNILLKNDKGSFLILVVAFLLGLSFRTYFPGIAVPFVLLIMVSFVRKYSIKDNKY